jgi:hypothetical protein
MGLADRWSAQRTSILPCHPGLFGGVAELEGVVVKRIGRQNRRASQAMHSVQPGRVLPACLDAVSALGAIVP